MLDLVENMARPWSQVACARGICDIHREGKITRLADGTRVQGVLRPASSNAGRRRS
jgi:hypothetical protein